MQLVKRDPSLAELSAIGLFRAESEKVILMVQGILGRLFGKWYRPRQPPTAVNMLRSCVKAWANWQVSGLCGARTSPRIGTVSSPSASSGLKPLIRGQVDQ